jgi:hypothetical protein
MKVFCLEWRANAKKGIVGLLVGVSMMLLGVSSGVGQDVVGLEDIRISITMKEEAFGTVLGYLANRYDLSFGVELAPGDGETHNFQFAINRRTAEAGFLFTETRTRFSLDLKDAGLAEVMDAIVGQMQGYRWEISEDVVNIIPAECRDERLLRLMELRIDYFAMEKKGDLLVGKILDRILDLPEVKAFEKANNLRIHRGDFDALFRPLGQLRLSKVSFRQLLNKAAVAKKGNWRIAITNGRDQLSKSTIFIEI